MGILIFLQAATTTGGDVTHDVGIAATIGFVLPLIISFIVQSHWKPGAKAIIAFVVCILAAVATSFFSNEVRIDDPAWDWVTWFGAMFISAVASYRAIWRPTNIAPSIETKTNLEG